MGVRVLSSAPSLVTTYSKKGLFMTFTSKPALMFSVIFWLAVTAFGVYFLTNLVEKKEAGKKGFINFGIDLVGGTFLTLDVKVDEAIKNDLMGLSQGLIEQLKKENKAVPSTTTMFEKEAKVALGFDSELAASEALNLFNARSAQAKASKEGKSVVISFTRQQVHDLEKEAVEGNISILRTRLDAFGAGEVGIIPQGERRISIELPNVSDPEKAKARIGTAAILEFKPVYDYAHSSEQLIERAGGSIPEGTMIIPGKKDESGFYLVPSFAKVTGKMLNNAQYQYGGDQLGKASPHTVLMTFKPEGRSRFAEVTRENVGKQLAIILDNVVVSAPTVHQAIEDGTAVISGNFTQETADELVALLKSGAFSAPVEVIEERTIGPSLGKAAIHQGLVSCLIALVLLFLI